VKEAEREYILSETKRRMVNGYSRISPPCYDFIADSYARNSMAAFLRDLRGLGISEVVVETDSLTETERSELRSLLARGQVRHRAKLRSYEIVEVMPE
jgi:hypothetical protein